MKDVMRFLDHNFGGDSKSAIRVLRELASAKSEYTNRLIRHASNSTSHKPMFYLQVYRLWQQLGFPDLKPATRNLKVLIIADVTMKQIEELLTLFCGVRGVSIEITYTNFDSVETEVYSENSMIYRGNHDICVLLLSEFWVEKYLGTGSLIEKDRVEKFKDVLTNIVGLLDERFSGKILVSTLYESSFPPILGRANNGLYMGRSTAIDKINLEISEFQNSKVIQWDLKKALHLGGGLLAGAGRNYFNAKMPFEIDGLVSVARQLASNLIEICGQDYRLLALDLDNTIWGGEIAEVGSDGVEVGSESPLALGYKYLQSYIASLAGAGLVLAAVSRNNASVFEKINLIDEQVLKQEIFSGYKISFQPKSTSILEISQSIGFGSEYILFIDDSIFELSEVVVGCEHVDILKAGQFPGDTLSDIVSSRLLEKSVLQEQDRLKRDQYRRLSLSNDKKKSFSSNSQFLRSLEIILTIKPLCSRNIERIVQLLAKSNQYNLTTRRHSEGDLKKLVAGGADVWAIEYSDEFGSQGLISVLVLVHCEDDSVFINSWVMSCRVLNRHVEMGVFDWMNKKYSGKLLIGEYIRTDKNDLVCDHFSSLGFKYDVSMSRWVWRCDAEEVKHEIFKINEIE